MPAAAATHPDRARRGIVYSRISKDDARDELGVRRHTNLCLNLAQRLGVDVAPEDIYVDNDTSASKGLKRGNWDRARATLRRGAHGVLITYDSDRLSREDLRQVEDLIDLLRDHDVLLHSVNSGLFDLNTVDGRERARGAAVRARAEVERTSKRLKDKMDELAADGRPNGGPRPYGYERIGRKPERAGDPDTREMVPHPDEAPVVVEVFKRVVAGETITAIARSLSERGIRTTRGMPWAPANLRRVAINPVYAGLRVHRGEVVGKGAWPALVPEEQWHRSVKLLDDRRDSRTSGRGRSTARTNLLTGGLIVCGKCGKRLWGKPHHKRGGERVAMYVCKPTTDPTYPGCGGVAIRADHVDQLVAARVIDLVESTSFAKALATRTGVDATAAAKVREIERALDDLADSFGEGRTTMREWERAKVRLNARLADARAQLTADTTDAAVGGYAGREGALRAEWPSMSLDRRQAIVRATIKPVVIQPVGKRTGARFDETRVQVQRLDEA